MADVRINALATTATSSSSDDFIAIDGSANGTRKLSAFSPTFGGNLTVSGTGTSSFANGALVKVGLPTYAPNTNLGGNLLQVKSSSGYAYLTIGNGDAVDSTAYIGGASGYTVFGTVSDAGVRNETMRIVSGGNVLVGTTTDSGNGKLQLATHTTSAGGIGFGTDTSWYRTAAGSLVLDHIGGTGPTANLAAGGSIKTRWFWNGSDSYFETTTAAGLIFRTNSTTALTLDSSQNATFAGRAAINGSYATVSTGNYTLSLGNFAAGTRTNAGLRTDSIGDLDISAGSGGSLSLNYDTSVPVLCFGNFSIASGKTLKLGNAYTASVVVPTGYVTIQDSTGTTYKVCVLL